jgi:hypothetical protein
MNGKVQGDIAAAAKGAIIALSMIGIVACQGSTGGSTPPPASGTVAMNAPESPPAGPPAMTQPPGQAPDPAAGAASAPPAGATASGAPDPSRGVAANTPGAVTVAQASAMAPGSKATVRGLYFGWRGPCHGAPPTRSAWQLADSDQKGAACLYVDGPFPPGLDPAGRGAPTWVRVDGELITAGPDRFLASHKAERELP